MVARPQHKEKAYLLEQYFQDRRAGQRQAEQVPERKLHRKDNQQEEEEWKDDLFWQQISEGHSACNSISKELFIDGYCFQTPKT